MDDTKLDETLVWRDDGCLAEPAMHAVADAELSFLPDTAWEHAQSCPWCAERIGRIAVLSLEIEEAIEIERAAQLGSSPQPLLAASPTRPLTAAARRKLPIVPIALALLTALTCKLPLLSRLDPNELGHSAASLAHMLMPIMLKLIHQLAHSRAGSALVFCSAAFLLAGSALLARSSSSGRAGSLRETGGNP